jgi:hypothetical protein
VCVGEPDQLGHRHAAESDLALQYGKSHRPESSFEMEEIKEFLDLSQAFDELTVSSSNISRELQRLVDVRATMSLDNNNEDADMVKKAESCYFYFYFFIFFCFVF